jgi:hypothetical protein
MNIPRDILFYIIFKIDDPKTFVNISIASKECNKYCDNIKNVKFGFEVSKAYIDGQILLIQKSNNNKSICDLIKNVFDNIRNRKKCGKTSLYLVIKMAKFYSENSKDFSRADSVGKKLIEVHNIEYISYEEKIESEKYYQDIFRKAMPTNYENYFESELFLEK